jgi:hypothetical protein
MIKLNKKNPEKYPFYEEKSLVGSTPKQQIELFSSFIFKKH